MKQGVPQASLRAQWYDHAELRAGAKMQDDYCELRNEAGRSEPSEQRELQASLRAMQIDDCELWMQMLAKR